MKQAEVFDKYTDFISDTQDILIWGFDSRVIRESYDTYSYTVPVEIQLFRALAMIAESGKRTVRGKCFTVFTGDFGPGFELYGIGINAGINSRIADIISGCFHEIKGYKTMEYGRMPYVPFIPWYRYENSLVIEYTSETRRAGKFRKNDAVISGLKVIYRVWESAEGPGVKERYCGVVN